MFTVLPPEILLNVVAYCSIQEISTLRQLSRDWNRFLEENGSTVYHTAAIFHGFIESNESLEDAQSKYPGIWLDNLNGWKDLCQRWFQLENNWEGRGETPRITLLKSSGDDLHRFKLDEREGARFVITTHREGGLRVISMDTDTVLFALAKRYVRKYAHCEYENGFLVFDRLHQHALEVWRLESLEWTGVYPVSAYKPDRTQLFAQMQSLDADAAYPRRGNFAPWALFKPPYNPRAYRMVYPTLLVGSEEGKELYIFDLPSATLVQTIPIPHEHIPPFSLTVGGAVRILYVELGTRHVFVCTMHGVLIIPRDWSTEPGARNVYLDFPSMDPSMRIPQLVRHYAARVVPAAVPQKNEIMGEYMVTAPRLPEQSTALVRLGDDQQEFSAVHVSPSGKDFVAITWSNVAYLVRNFEEAFCEKPFSELALRINLQTPAKNLAFEHDRIVIQTLSDVFVFALHTVRHGVVARHSYPGLLTPTPNPFPELTAFKLQHFSNPLALRYMSCVKLTRTGVWFDWAECALWETHGIRPPIIQNELVDFGDMLGEDHPYAKRTICLVDFAPQQRL